MPILAFPGGSGVKKPPSNSGGAGDLSLIPELGRSPRGGNGNPFKYTCLKNPLDRGVWQATVHGVARATEHNLVTD